MGGAPSWVGGSCQRRLSAAGPGRALGGADRPLSSQAARGGGEGLGAAAAGRPVGGQQAFTIHVDEPDGERRRGGPVTQKEDEESAAALGLRAAVCALGERRPLAPLGNAMDLSFGR